MLNNATAAAAATMVMGKARRTSIMNVLQLFDGERCRAEGYSMLSSPVFS
jgi:hypothetical protein